MPARRRRSTSRSRPRNLNGSQRQRRWPRRGRLRVRHTHPTPVELGRPLGEIAEGPLRIDQLIWDEPFQERADARWRLRPLASFIPARVVYGTIAPANPNIPSPRDSRSGISSTRRHRQRSTGPPASAPEAEPTPPRAFVRRVPVVDQADPDRSVGAALLLPASRPYLVRTSQVRSRRAGPEAILQQDQSARRRS